MAETDLITLPRATVHQALEVLEALQGGCTDHNDGTVEAITVWCPEVIDALRAALEQPYPDPAHEYRKGFIDGQIEMRDRPEEQPEQQSYEREIQIEVESERAACIDDCNAEAKDDGTAQRIVERIRARSKA